MENWEMMPEKLKSNSKSSEIESGPSDGCDFGSMVWNSKQQKMYSSGSSVITAVATTDNQ